MLYTPVTNESHSRTLVNMLSINVADVVLTLVGFVIKGQKPLEKALLKISEEDSFKILMLKSPIRKHCLFSAVILPRI